MNLRFLERQRGVTFEWHYDQVKRWLDFDGGRHLDSVLVYASFELRCAIERYLLELLVLLSDEGFSPELVKGTKRITRNFKKLLARIEPYYGKRVEFTNIVSSLTPGLPKVHQADLSYLMNRWNDLSAYCHKLYEPDESWRSPNSKYQKKGFQLIEDIIDVVDGWFRVGERGILSKESMPPDTADVYSMFIESKIDSGQVRRMLDLLPR